MGRQQGLRGEPAKVDIASKNKGCNQKNISEYKTLFLDGHAVGIVRFCTKENGFELGLGNEKYYGVCPTPLEEEFLDAFERGKKVRQRLETKSSTSELTQRSDLEKIK